MITEGIIARNATVVQISIQDHTTQVASQRTVSDPIKAVVGEHVVLVPVREVPSDGEIVDGQSVCKGRIVNRLHVHVVEDLSPER